MSVPKRFFVSEPGRECVLTGDNFNHARNVLRLKEGDEVTLFDGSGREYDAVIAKVQKAEMTLNVTASRLSEKDPKARLCLLVGALKGDKTELVVQKATELGVEKIVVFSSRYSSASVNENKLARLRRVAAEAAGQCLRSTVPEVGYIEDFCEALRAASDYRTKLFACEFLEGKGEALPVSDSYALVVGSEGGFTQEEFDEAKKLGFCGVSLGRRILRAETAAIALLSVVAYLGGELK